MDESALLALVGAASKKVNAKLKRCGTREQ